ncbi:MAG: hypothetical protein C0397_17310 [Odoribacter sp.]|nr:hypothetical protein [Odoribacter sp.]
MKQQEEIQAIFLKWYKHHGVRSMQQIRQNVTNLCNSYEFDGNGLYLIFYPLVRKGFIEFIGEDTYQIAPSIIINDQISGMSTGINLNEEQIKQIMCISEIIEIDMFGVIRFKSETNQTQTICKEINCAFTISNINQVLSNFPMIREVVSRFDKNITLDGYGYHYKLSKHKIDENSKIKSIGIFTTEKDSHKYYFFDGTDCYEIPFKEHNPEGWSIAETYQAIKEGIEFLVYNDQTKQLIVQSINIPILIDRILRITSLHFSNGVTTANYKAAYKNISPPIIKQLNRIFETKIKITNE